MAILWLKSVVPHTASLAAKKAVYSTILDGVGKHANVSDHTYEP